MEVCPRCFGSTHLTRPGGSRDALCKITWPGRGALSRWGAEGQQRFGQWVEWGSHSRTWKQQPLSSWPTVLPLVSFLSRPVPRRSGVCSFLINGREETTTQALAPYTCWTHITRSAWLPRHTCTCGDDFKIPSTQAPNEKSLYTCYPVCTNNNIGLFRWEAENIYFEIINFSLSGRWNLYAPTKWTTSK